MIIFGILLTLTLLFLLICYLCYRYAFYAKKPEPPCDGTIELPEGEIYEEYRDKMEQWVRQVRALPHEDFQIRSFDGLTLRGKFYEYAPGAPIELMFHGYRGSAERDLSGGVQRCFRVRHSAFVVDQRCSGGSEGHVITFGVKEHLDCLSWVDFLVSHFGPQVRIILSGISMGASTVLTAAGQPLPENVVGVLADCGYSCPKDIICHVIRQMGLPPKLCYGFVRLGAKLFGHFDLEGPSPLQALPHCRLPVILFHGEADDFVPCHMSRLNYEACAGRKRLVTIPGAGHGLSYAADPQRYLAELRDFFGEDL